MGFSEVRGQVTLELSKVEWILRGAPKHPCVGIKWWGQKRGEELTVSWLDNPSLKVRVGNEKIWMIICQYFLCALEQVRMILKKTRSSSIPINELDGI